MTHTVGPEGQVVIEKDIRDRLGVKPGWLALQMLVDGHVEIHFVPPEHSESLAGAFAKYAHNAKGKSWDEIREAGWDQAVRERVEGWLAQESHEESR
ncbi:MAG: AbrB/MazE/SpoVT family DNA-binding domain-containing protein [Dehalococcoidia bacterium]